MKAKLYRRKGDIEAVQLTKENVEELTAWCNGVQVEEIDPFDETQKFVGINFPTGHGVLRVSEGEYLIHYPNSGFGKLSKTAFEILHEEVE